ncbi:MAG: PIN domain-containing protein [Gemmatimonadetes bacterium]|nr:PIN domain-containing protein [Gemmatimonadota bacterium]
MGAVRPVYLLDVNVLIALFDPGHLHHDRAHDWFASTGVRGWATCPVTENGFVRVLANPAYPGRRTPVADAADRLRRFTAADSHVFWPGTPSLLNPGAIRAGKLTGHREITEAWLLALAVENSGALATFDESIRRAAVVGAEDRHIALISG